MAGENPDRPFLDAIIGANGWAGQGDADILAAQALKEFRAGQIETPADPANKAAREPSWLQKNVLQPATRFTGDVLMKQGIDYLAPPDVTPPSKAVSEALVPQTTGQVAGTVALGLPSKLVGGSLGRAAISGAAAGIGDALTGDDNPYMSGAMASGTALVGRIAQLSNRAQVSGRAGFVFNQEAARGVQAQVTAEALKNVLPGIPADPNKLWAFIEGKGAPTALKLKLNGLQAQVEDSIGGIQGFVKIPPSLKAAEVKVKGAIELIEPTAIAVPGQLGVGPQLGVSGRGDRGSVAYDFARAGDVMDAIKEFKARARDVLKKTEPAKYYETLEQARTMENDLISSLTQADPTGKAASIYGRYVQAGDQGYAVLNFMRESGFARNTPKGIQMDFDKLVEALDDFQRTGKRIPYLERLEGAGVQDFIKALSQDTNLGAMGHEVRFPPVLGAPGFRLGHKFPTKPLPATIPGLGMLGGQAAGRGVYETNPQDPFNLPRFGR